MWKVIIAERKIQIFVYMEFYFKIQILQSSKWNQFLNYIYINLASFVLFKVKKVRLNWDLYTDFLLQWKCVNQYINLAKLLYPRYKSSI